MAALLWVARREFARNGYSKTTMAHIARAAGLTKRTLYLWHDNKASLFRACLDAGTTRFPKIAGAGTEPREALSRYFAALICELAGKESNAMGRLLLREGSEFPELATMVERSHTETTLLPLAEYLRGLGLERPDSLERTELLVMMALAPVHNSLLLGRSMPDAAAADAHARFVVDFFLDRAGDRPLA